MLLAACAPTATPAARKDHNRARGPEAHPANTIVPPPVNTSHFYAIWSTAPAHTPVIEEFSVKTGQPIRAVASVLASALWVGDLVQAPDGWIWFTESSGPRLRNDTAGGDPEPNSCSGAAVKLDPGTGRQTVVFHTPRAVWFDAAVPSPNGRFVAYQTGPCARSYFNAHFVIRDLRTGRQWSIGQDARTCHDLSWAAWTPDGQTLLFGYGPSALAAGVASQEGYGTCQASEPDELATVSALSPASIRSVSLTAAPKGCGYVEGVSDTWGILALETCGGIGLGGYGLGRSAVVQLSSRLEVIGRWRLPPGQDGTSLSVSPNRRLVLIDEYEAPIYAGTRTVQQQMDWIAVFNGSRLHVIRSVPDATDSISGAVW